VHGATCQAYGLQQAFICISTLNSMRVNSNSRIAAVAVEIFKLWVEISVP
jgi:hypothetical protein